ncbi:MAG: UDP-3-O-(3-hydroxymyristoyl)glucosamine N-acyltransferase [Puniceicoccales bacterium]|jgi:UDP-3-O-[3-hydroxymyristoyl] glucosamine N-acyltransferase|nr:UDP-3-O-(3-hydroxymyristoyl)glucosamine N-acyltransferase [Puniceicoccales bacterium]
MRFQFSVEELREIVQPTHVTGNFQGNITRIASLQEAKIGALSFLANPKYARDVATSQASLLLLPENFDCVPIANQVIFFCENPSIALAKICQHIEKLNVQEIPAEIHSSAIIHPTAQLARNISIGAHVVIGEGVTIGENTVIGAGTIIERHVSLGHDVKIFPHVSVMSFSKIGSYVTLHSGVVIGSDGFGFEEVDGRHKKIPQIGNVILEDYVDIGAHTTIDRARFASTIIGQGTKIDNLVQIGHNVRIGKNCIIVAQVGIAGSTTIGNNVTIGGQVGIAGHLHIADGTQIGAQSGVTKDTQPHSVLLGSPAASYKEAVRQFASLAKLPEILKKIKKMPSNDFNG